MTFADYDAVRRGLYDAQHKKCAYCERYIGEEGNPIEHLRPKAYALRGSPWAKTPPNRDAERYWWLAWAHANLFLACSTCNCASNKGNWFPLEEGTAPLALPDEATLERLLGDNLFDASSEKPLLIDPGVDDPLDHIVWVPQDPREPVERIEWRPVDKTPRGRYTIWILGLDRGVADHVGRHVRLYVYPRVKGVSNALPPLARRQWEELTRDLLGAHAQFTAATHGAIDFFVPKPERERLGIVLERPMLLAQSP